MIRLKNKNIIMLGSGGHAKVLIDIILSNKLKVYAIIDTRLELAEDFKNIKHIKKDKEIEKKYSPERYEILNGIGIIPGKKILLRKKLYDYYKKLGFNFTKVIHSTAVISKNSKLGEGINIMAGCTIQPGTEIKQNSIINTGANIDHDCFIGENVHIAPGVTLCGNVKVGENSFIGAGVVCIPGTVVPPNSIIPAGKILK